MFSIWLSCTLNYLLLDGVVGNVLDCDVVLIEFEL